MTGSTAVRQQQGLVDEHIETLMRELEGKVGEKVDLNHMINLFAFDIMSHLTFGESFNSLPTGEHHPFTADFFEKIKIFPIIYVSREYTAVNLLLKAIMMIPSVKKQQQEYFEATTALVEKRMELVDSSQHDFMKYVSSTSALLCSRVAHVSDP
ncbi:hypothetical protein Daus18300_012035 [Diaporthe australafricana]|uniref:Cytochrome P450 n=1 Tax=Diaporthe australafricana TaxID=127596 RepID=A0ABR3W432_9PEZI